MRSTKKIIFIVIMALFMGVFVLPQNIKTSIFGQDTFLNKADLHLWLDLQWWTQLDYRIDLSKVEKYNNDDNPDNNVDKNSIIQWVRATIERRVNNLWVSEPNIFLADIGNEKHIIVELAGIDDIDEAKKIVGKTIQLEFKEKKTDAEIKMKQQPEIKAAADTTLIKVQTANANFTKIGEWLKNSNDKITFTEEKKFKNEIPDNIKEKLWILQDWSILNEVIKADDGYSFNGWQISIKQAFSIFKTISKEEVDRTQTEQDNFDLVAKELNNSFEEKEQLLSYYPELLQSELQTLEIGKFSEVKELENKFIIIKLTDKKEVSEQIQASHILVSFQWADRSEQTRTKTEAKQIAQDILTKTTTTDFSALAKEFSDWPSAEQGGDLWFFGKGQMAPEFETAAFALENEWISELVETSFWYHIIKKIWYKPAEETKYSIQKISIDKTNIEAKSQIDVLYTRISPKEVTKKEEQITYQKISYSLEPNIWKDTGLDGSMFIRASVSFDQYGKPFVSITFNNEGAKLFWQITKRNIGKPLAIFVWWELISAPNVNDAILSGAAQISGRYTLPEAAELSQDLNTGAISAPIIIAGQYKVGATLWKDSMMKSLYAWLFGLILLSLYMILQYKLFGLVANLSLSIYALILIFILKTSWFIWVPIVLTLAGVAGLILSIGLAVDANILIFERVKEELKEGKSIPASIAIGFDRAWSSIRDSNISSLITCFILAIFGTSIIRGFAINLAIGILVSMFTAVTITRVLLFYFFSNSKKSNYLVGKIGK